jgi:hypothetical protein
MGLSDRRKGLVDKYYYILFQTLPSENETLAEVLADIYDRNPLVYDWIYDDLRFSDEHVDAWMLKEE